MTQLYTYKIKVSYRGTGYFGWQVQSSQEGKTIQGEINKALKIITKSEQIKTLGAGRTDAGVHALGQVFRAEIPLNIQDDALVRALNSLLCEDIRILKVRRCYEKFNPISDSLWKEYVYLFTNCREVSPFGYQYVTDYGFHLEFELMQDACKLFQGKKDFCNYQCTGTEVPDTTREIFECDLTEQKCQGHFEIITPDYYIFRVRGGGFLKQMVRLMVGTLWNIGRKKITVDALQNSFDKKLPHKLGAVAPPQGLYLRKIRYPDGF